MLHLKVLNMTNIRNGIGGMKKLIKRIYMYFKGKQIWNEKMSEPLKIRLTSDSNISNNKQKEVN